MGRFLKNLFASLREEAAAKKTAEETEEKARQERISAAGFLSHKVTVFSGETLVHLNDSAIISVESENSAIDLSRAIESENMSAMIERTETALFCGVEIIIPKKNWLGQRQAKRYYTDSRGIILSETEAFARLYGSAESLDARAENLSTPLKADAWIELADLREQKLVKKEVQEKGFVPARPFGATEARFQASAATFLGRNSLKQKTIRAAQKAAEEKAASDLEAIILLTERVALKRAEETREKTKEAWECAQALLARRPEAKTVEPIVPVPVEKPARVMTWAERCAAAKKRSANSISIPVDSVLVKKHEEKISSLAEKLSRQMAEIKRIRAEGIVRINGRFFMSEQVIPHLEEKARGTRRLLKDEREDLAALKKGG